MASDKLQLNDDGTVTVPVPGRTPIQLREPRLVELQQIIVLLRGADAALDQAAGTDSTERITVMYGAESPHAQAFIEIVRMLSGQELTPDDLYGWAGNTGTIARLINHATDPLAGQASASQNLLDALRGAVASSAPTGVPSPVSNGQTSPAESQPSPG